MLAAVAFWSLSTPWFSDTLSRWWEEPRRAEVELPTRSDVAVVLGGLVDPLVSTADHTEFGPAAERLLEAVSLYRTGRVGAVLVTSGSGDLLSALPEAPELERFALAWGVKAADLLVESASRNTRENAVNSLPLLAERQVRSVVLVTSAFHMKRAAAVFRKALAARPEVRLLLWPVDTRETRSAFPLNAFADPQSLMQVQQVLKEVVGYGVYALQGYL